MEFGLIPAQLTLLAFSRDAHYDGANLLNRELLKRLPKAITLHHNVRFATKATKGPQLNKSERLPHQGTSRYAVR